MIKLHQFPAAFGLPNGSPFCMKAETWLRLAGLKYEVVVTPDPRKAPHGKLPYIEDNGQLVPDSHDIIEHLEKAHKVNLDAGLSAQEKAVAHAYTRMLSEATYFGLLYSRWVDQRYWPTVRAEYFGSLPPVVRSILPAIVNKQVKRDVYGQGTGRLATEEIYARVAQDVQAIAEHLGAKPYFMGDKPTNVDASVYAFVANMWEARLVTPLKEIVGRHKNLVAYCQRMRQRCFPELK